MTLKYALQKEDYLQYQLYTASKLASTKKNRQKSRLLVPLVLLAFGIYSYFKKPESVGFVVYPLTAALWYLIYPFFSARRYKKYYDKHIDETYQGRIGRQATLSFNPDHIYSEEDQNEGKIAIKELVELVEIATHFFIVLKSGLSLIIPKQHISDRERFLAMMNNYGLSHTKEVDWKWK